MRQQQQGRPLRLQPPDGGWGWVILVAAISVNVMIPGTIKSFGVLLVEFLKVFEVSLTETSWMPALCYFCYSSFGNVRPLRLLAFQILLILSWLWLSYSFTQLHYRLFCCSFHSHLR